MIRLAPAALLCGLLAGLAPARAARAEGPLAPAEEARKAAVDNIRKDLRRWASSPYAPDHREDILKAIESLGTLGGPDAARAALEAVAFDEKEVRDRAFVLMEKEHPKALVKPLAELLDDKRFRRDWDLQRRIAHALSVIADVGAVEPLTALLGCEDAAVVASAADALATFASAPHKARVDPVKRMIDVYESTWNLKESVRPEDHVIAKVMAGRWDVYGKSLKAALQALTRTTLSRPMEWRRWWNDNKKLDNW